MVTCFLEHSVYAMDIMGRVLWRELFPRAHSIFNVYQKIACFDAFLCVPVETGRQRGVVLSICLFDSLSVCSSVVKRVNVVF